MREIRFYIYSIKNIARGWCVYIRFTQSRDRAALVPLAGSRHGAPTTQVRK